MKQIGNKQTNTIFKTIYRTQSELRKQAEKEGNKI